jgi:hypothetical protein
MLTDKEPTHPAASVAIPLHKGYAQFLACFLIWITFGLIPLRPGSSCRRPDIGVDCGVRRQPYSPKVLWICYPYYAPLDWLWRISPGNFSSGDLPCRIFGSFCVGMQALATW